MSAETTLRLLAVVTLLCQVAIVGFTLRHCRYVYRFRLWDAAWHWFAVKVALMVAARAWVLLYLHIPPAIDALLALANSLILCIFLAYLLKIFHNETTEPHAPGR